MSLTNKCRQVRMLLTDVDGVLTDGKLYYNFSGECMKVFNVKDGLICKKLFEQNIDIGIITGRSSSIVEKRAEELGISTIYQNQKDKIEALSLIMKKHGLDYKNIAYIGDDVNDLSIIKKAGLTASPSDALNEIMKQVDYVCSKAGGKGAFREFADLILGFR